MKNQDNPQVLENEAQPQNEQPQLIDVNDTAILEYIDIVKREYENERNKKQSFENRACLIMALL